VHAEDDIDRLVLYLCVDPNTARYGPYLVPPSDGGLPRGTDLIPGRLRRYRLVDRLGKAIDLHLYAGLAEVGGLLWEQEVRVLLRLGASGQPGLPEILDGGYEEPEATAKVGSRTSGVALIATRGSDRTLADQGAADAMRAEPALAITQFQQLAEALAELHDLGALHRNLVPGSILADLSTGQPRLWIARFEMSALIGNLLRRTVDSETEREELRALFLGHGEPDLRTLSCQPFERLDFLFPASAPEPMSESPTSDVFSLGALVWDWFCDPAQLTALPLPDSVVDRHAEVHSRMLAALSADGPVPARLGTLLRAMLAREPRERPTAHEAFRRLADDSDTILRELMGGEPARPYLVVNIPREAGQNLHNWRWLRHSTDTPQGRDELAALMADELGSAKLMHAARGALPFVRTGDATDRQNSRLVLMGRRALWFCQHYQRRTWGKSGPALDEALIIKYAAQREHPATRRSFEELRYTSGQVAIPAVEVVSIDVADSVMDDALAGRPSWKQLETTLAKTAPDEVAYHEYASALDWLLAYQGAELAARTYAYMRTDSAQNQVMESAQKRVTLEWDRKREQKAIHSDALLTKFADSPWLRPSLGRFFLNMEDDEGTAAVEIGGDRKGRPNFAHDRSVWTVVPERAGDDRVILQWSEGVSQIPECGWIRPLSDLGTRTALARQAAARWDLMRTRGLLSQLHDPRSVRTLSHRWAQAGRKLDGSDAPGVVRDMLSYRPFFAIQGPPGTGKTTVVSEAVFEYLKAEPAARVLVSAQSGYALDNLAQRILARFGELDADGLPTDVMDVTALRVTSRSGALPDSRVTPWTRDALAVRSADRIRARVAAVLRGNVPEGPLRNALMRWHYLLDPSSGENVLPELGDRLERAASLVFATCVTATAEAVTPGGTRSRFDWVIVEEAAKAWPTELAMPLTCGTSWTLIGDHRQLGAHRRSDFERFLADCAGDPSPELAVLAEQRETYLDAFDTFRQLFEDADGGTRTAQERRRLPLRLLTTQFRMRQPIAEIVSRVFYPASAEAGPDGLPPGLLRTGAEVPAAPLRSPEALVGASVVWLDTRGVPDCGDEPSWSNRGEARLAAALIDRMKPRPTARQHGYSGEPLAVLTPYRAQARLLMQYDALRPHVSTIHAFQGREADIVVVSMVRDKRHGPAGVTWSSLGHLAQQNLINVMMSRARRLLVIIGNFDHFAMVDRDIQPAAGADVTAGEGPFWGRLCTAVRLYGAVLPAGEVIDL
jgi:hypothetical protein